MSPLSPVFDSQEICRAVWQDRFRLPGEASPADSFRRVVEAVFAADPQRESQQDQCLALMCAAIFCPDERLVATIGGASPAAPPLRAGGASVGRWLAIEHQPLGLLQSLETTVSALRFGGRLELDLTALPPAGARLGQGGAGASGVLPVLDVWETMARRMLSEGLSWQGRSRALLSCDHPDLPAFAAARSEPGRLERLGLMVAVSDAFMAAVEADAEWDLGHVAPPLDPGTQSLVRDRQGADGVVRPWFVHQVVSARALWREILRHDDARGDCGVLFVQRSRYMRPATAPTAETEAPLWPAWGPAVGGSINLAALLQSQGRGSATVDAQKLRAAVTLGVRFLDNAIDVMPYGVPEQEAAAKAERRIGLGVVGLGTLLQQLGQPYGSQAARVTVRKVLDRLRDAAYRASISLAEERESYPAFGAGEASGAQSLASLPDILRRGIESRGLRNGALLCVAESQATADLLGCASPGISPVPAQRHRRRLRDGETQAREIDCFDAGFLATCRRKGLDPASVDPETLGPAWVAADRIGPDRQAAMQATVQPFLDSPLDCPSTTADRLDDVARDQLFRKAHELGCQRFVLRSAGAETPIGSEGDAEASGGLSWAPDRGGFESQSSAARRGPVPRLADVTYRESWPPLDAQLYVTIFDEIDQAGGRRPCDIVIRCKCDQPTPDLESIAKALSQVLRSGSGTKLETMLRDLEQIADGEGAEVRGQRVPSLPAVVALIVRDHLAARDGSPETLAPPRG